MDDVDLDTSRLRVPQAVTAIGWEIHFGQPKTAAGRRPIAPDPMTVAIVREHRKLMIERRLLVGDGFVDHGLAFCQPDGAPLPPEGVYQAFNGVPGATPCQTSHSTAFGTPGRQSPWSAVSTRAWFRSASATPTSR